MRRLIGLIVVLVALLASPAGAKVPTFKYKLPSIVPGKSIGGLKVGMTRAEAKTTWGAPDDCYTYKGLTTCSYSFPGPIGEDWVSSFYVKNRRVVSMTIETTENDRAMTKVRRLKTAKGIKIGSLMSAARNKYDIPRTGGGEANESWAKLKQGRRCTTFYAPEPPWKVISSISVGICGSAGGV